MLTLHCHSEFNEYSMIFKMSDNPNYVSFMHFLTSRLPQFRESLHRPLWRCWIFPFCIHKYGEENLTKWVSSCYILRYPDTNNTNQWINDTLIDKHLVSVWKLGYQIGGTWQQILGCILMAVCPCSHTCLCGKGLWKTLILKWHND